MRENDFDIDGNPDNPLQIYGMELQYARMDEASIQTAIEGYNKTQNNDFKLGDDQYNAFYEKRSNTVNISIDDVGVKKQVEHREENEKKDLKYVRNTIVHIENMEEKYFLNGPSTVTVLPILIAFLIHNRLINNYIQFFVDGEKTLHSAILNKLKWHKSFGILLDWYHLRKKCETELSMAINGKDMRNLVLDNIQKYLWQGKIDMAINVLESLDSSFIKNYDHITILINYFERNRSYIPCYALRKELGLRNSSNKGEKSNDLIVSERQKHNGMSWSKSGSIALATITTAHLNNELQRWFDKRTLAFKLAS